MRILLGTIFLALGLSIYISNSKSERTSWYQGGKVLSPFDFYQTKILLDEQDGQIEKTNLGNSEKMFSFFTRKEKFLIKKGAKLSLVVEPHCGLTSKPPVHFHPNLEVVTATKKSNKDLPVKSLVLNFSESVNSSDLEAWANSEPCVVGLANRRMAMPTARFTDPLLNRQTHWEAFNVSELYNKLSQLESALQAEVVIGVIDSGIELSHPDLKANLWVNQSELQGREASDDDQNSYVDDIYGYDFASRTGDPSHKHSFDHGTHVAGLAAAVGGNEFGGRGIISEKVKIMPLNVTGKYNGAMSEDIEEAIYYAVHNGAHVINISFGSPGKAAAIAHAITYAVNNGVVVVTSIGNGGVSLDEEFYFPGSYGVNIPGLISVGAYEVNTGNLCQVSNFSNSYVELAAPGCDSNNPKQGLYSTKRGASYGYQKGTSMAAPIVSGGAALLYSYLASQNLITQESPMQIERALTTDMSKDSNLQNYIREGSSFQLSRLLELMPL